MKKLLYFLIVIGLPMVITAQNWTLVNSNTTDDIRNVYFKDETVGFFLTNMGRIYKTIDGGENWTFLHQDIDFIDDVDPNYPTKELSIVATNDSLFAFYNLEYESTRIKSPLSSVSFTKDTLSHWIKKPVFWNNEIWDVLRVNQLLGGSAPSNFVIEEFAVSDNYIWATNTLKIYSSDDFGVTWQEHQFTTISLTSGPYQSYYNGTNNMVAVTQYPTIIHKTTDGINWTSTDQGLDGIYFYFIDHIKYLAYNFFGSNSKIYSTNDGGQNFSEEDLVDIPLGIYSKNNNSDIIFLYGKNGMLYKTTNAGGLLSVKETVKKKLKVYPNPAKEKINLEYDYDINIQNVQLLDLSGKIIRTYDSNFQEINIRGVAKGNYLLIIRTPTETQSEKIIVK